MSPERLAFLAWVEEQAARATPYCWPAAENVYLGKGLEDSRHPVALDCSGTVTCGLFNATGGKVDWRRFHNAARLFAELPRVEKPRPGDLAFYGPPGRINHVMVVASDGVRVVGASGGNRHTLSREIAARMGACVKFKASHLYRPDFQGFRTLPLG